MYTQVTLIRSERYGQHVCNIVNSAHCGAWEPFKLRVLWVQSWVISAVIVAVVRIDRVQEVVSETAVPETCGGLEYVDILRVCNRVGHREVQYLLVVYFFAGSRRSAVDDISRWVCVVRNEVRKFC